MGSTFENCPDAVAHGNPRRYCACGWVEDPDPREYLGDKAKRLADSDDPNDLVRAQVYAILALAEQVNEHGRLVGQIGQLLESRATPFF